MLKESISYQVDIDFHKDPKYTTLQIVKWSGSSCVRVIMLKGKEAYFLAQKLNAKLQ